MQEMWVPSLVHEEPLEKEMATQSSILAWETMDRGVWQAIVHGVAKESDTTYRLNNNNKGTVGKCKSNNGNHERYWYQQIEHSSRPKA